MIFRATGRIPGWKGASLPPAAPAAPAVPSPHEIACRACDWFRADTQRCYRVCPICPADSRRHRPWDRMPRCPDGKWVR